MHRYIIIMTCFFLTVIRLPAQPAVSPREIFDEAEFFYARGDYGEAAYYFKQLVALYPDHAHFNFRLGECYLNMAGSERLAVPFFEKAVINTVPKKKYRGKDFNETSAPLHAFFYLGNAYRFDNRLDEALKAYDTFVSSPYYYGNYNQAIVDNEIQSCERARVIRDNPVKLTVEWLDSTINTTMPEIGAAVSADGSTLVFVRKLRFYDAIYLTTLTEGKWSEPENLNPAIGSDGDLYPTCLSSDGSAMFLVRDDPVNRDLYVSYKTGNTWTKAEKLRGRVNSARDETSAFLSPSGTALYFSSFRRGGEGGSDLYVCIKTPEGKWGKVRNLGRTVNTPFDEKDPCLTNDGNTLYFSSRGHESMGGYDIFFSNKIGNRWDKPVNAGYPLNDTGDNTGFTAIDGGTTGFFSKINSSGVTGEDIYRASIRSNLPLQHPQQE